MKLAWTGVMSLAGAGLMSLAVGSAWADPETGEPTFSVAQGASNRGSLRDRVLNLFGPDGINTLPVRALGCCGPAGHAFHFAASAKATNQALVDSLNSALQGSIATVPLPSPAGGFTYQYDPTLGVFTRSTESFGPIYADRAETTGRGKFTLGFSYTRFTFDSLDGQDLHDGSLQLRFVHEPTDANNRADPAGRGVGPAGIRGTPFPFEADTITTTLSIDLDTEVFLFSGTYGVLDNLDVGIAVPIIRNDLTIRAIATSNNESAAAGAAPVHLFDNGTNTQTATTSGDSTGIGDILLRAKYNFYRKAPLAMAALLELRLPTGDEDELRGIGSVRVRPFFVASANVLGLAPYVNLGFDLGDSNIVDNELLYKVGFDWGIVRRVTFAFDLLGRYVIDNSRIDIGKNQSITADTQTGDLKKAEDNIVDAAFGVKVNPWGTLLLTFNVLVPLNDTGLRDDLAFTFAVEGTF